MNAYELADDLQEFYDEFDGSFKSLEKSITMLRQQADRIAELEQNLSAYIVELELHKAMIQDLERKLNNV